MSSSRGPLTWPQGSQWTSICALMLSPPLEYGLDLLLESKGGKGRGGMLLPRLGYRKLQIQVEPSSWFFRLLACHEGSQPLRCELHSGEPPMVRNWWVQPTATQRNLEVDLPTISPWDDCSPSQALNCKLVRDSEPEKHLEFFPTVTVRKLIFFLSY